MYNVIVGKWKKLSSFMDGAEFQGRRTAKFMDFHAFNNSNIAFPRIKQVFQINPMAYSYNFMSNSTLKLTKTLEKTGITSSIIKTDFEDVHTGVLLASRYVKVVGMNTSTRKPVRNPDWYIDKYSYLKVNNVPPELTEKSVIPKFPTLYSSNLGTFWLKIEQFWPFEEISIFNNGGHLGYRTVLKDTILEEDHPESFQQNLVEIGSVVSEEKIFFNFIPPFF